MLCKHWLYAFVNWSYCLILHINHHSFVAEEFSLEITDVQLVDDGKYNCQVTPTDDDPRVLLSDEVTVTVIGKSFISVVVCRQSHV